MEDWEKELDDFLQTQKVEVDKASETEETKRARKFIEEIVQPTFKKLKDILNTHGREAFVVSGDLSRLLEVWYKGTREIKYYFLTINGEGITCKYHAISENDDGLKGNGDKDPTIHNTTKAHIGKDFVDIYTRDMRQNPRRTIMYS